MAINQICIAIQSGEWAERLEKANSCGYSKGLLKFPQPKGLHRKMSNPHDMNAAQGTYSSFIGTLKWSVPLIAVITFIVILLIS